MQLKNIIIIWILFSITLLSYGFIFNKYYFVNEDSIYVTKCNKITGDCVTEKSKRLK